ncbi:bacterioferritin-associated ferredoxin [Spartinivicinus poritis]|uniref:Bacterioferritin-associated ferredoxin n=1 Tax=Spartinivicinus poritis TaxID=2994640 RepID=A0ABT5U7N8_9GAMM|nr:bacterioferritin-associated ferredoxin [Spartinivicinus sp. A2-2]MDE1462396.1 bacterioferritin-associated ferredoxin [Spartinivicinus sp. A2-2]
MYVCICKNVTCHQIRNAVYNGANSLKDVRQELCVGTQCGKCVKDAKQVIKETLVDNQALNMITAVAV